MKYQNLTTREIIISWFSNKQRNINELDELGLHIFDWIFREEHPHYRGDVKSKIYISKYLIDNDSNFFQAQQNSILNLLNEFLKPNSPTFIPPKMLSFLQKHQYEFIKIKNSTNLINRLIDSNYDNHLLNNKEKISLLFNDINHIKLTEILTLKPKINTLIHQPNQYIINYLTNIAHIIELNKLTISDIYINEINGIEHLEQRYPKEEQLFLIKKIDLLNSLQKNLILKSIEPEKNLKI